MFLDTLKNIFEGNKELFEGLYIYDKWDWDTKYPVIKIDWAGDFQMLESLKDRAFDIFRRNQEKLGITCENTKNPSSCFDELIQKAYQKHNQRVAILIDEYDKPILDVIQNQEQAIQNREFLKGLYSIIKANDEYIKFCFLTGVSKFSKASIFSGLNMLVDISLMPKFGNICGYTQRELEENFKEHLEGLDLKEIKEWYNGYNFLKDRVYNPFDILQYLGNKMLDNYWFVSGNLGFLIKLMKEKKYFLPNLSNLIVDKKLLDVFDIEKTDIEVLLFQAGYLTIKETSKVSFGTIKYKLHFPNKEVKVSFSDVIIEYLTNQDPLLEKENIYNTLGRADIAAFIETLKNIFASIPYNNLTHIKGYEGFYATVVYVYLQSLGIDIIGEDITNKGRIDLALSIEDKIYIIEFKVIKSERERNTALKQIKEKKYYEKYTNQQKDIYLIGIEFGEEERNVISFEWEKV